MSRMGKARRPSRLDVLCFAVALAVWSCDLFSVSMAGADPVPSFHEGFESGHPLARGLRYDVANPSRVEIVRRPVRKGKYALKLTVLPGDKAGGGKNRAEAKILREDGEGAEVWYGWSFMIPKDFKEHPKRAKAFNMIGQWINLPDRSKGETFRTMPKLGPSIAVRYGTDKGRPGIGILYGIKGKNKRAIAGVHIEKGSWVDLVFHIRWAQDASGFVEIWVDGKPLMPFDGRAHRVFGPNMVNALPNIFKLGLYRGKRWAANTTNSIFIDEIRIGNSFNQVFSERSTAQGK